MQIKASSFDVNKDICSIPDATKILTINNVNPNNMQEAFTEYSPLYNCATEDIRSYMEYIGKINSFLTVCGSGEQVFNAVLNGATIVDCYDINKLCKYALALRIAALKSLTKDEYLVFYSCFDKRLFSKVVVNLKDDDLKFWSYVFDTYNSFEIASLIFGRGHFPVIDVVRINSYLRGSNYNKLKEMIDNVNLGFYQSDLFKLPMLLDGSYDGINLSNLYEYINCGFGVSLDKAIFYLDFIYKYLLPFLNENGRVIVTYMYAFNSRVRDYFMTLYNSNPELLKAITKKHNTAEEIEIIKKGFTWQNYSYSLLYDEALKRGIIPVQTRMQCVHGQSDAKEDMFLVLKK